MKTNLTGLWKVGLTTALVSMGACLSLAQDVPVFQKTEPPSSQPAETKGEAAKAETETKTETPANPAPAGPAHATNPPVVVKAAETPADLKVSEGLAEFIRLVQSGVNEDVLLSFINNSTNVYFLGSREIVYLSDLGVSSHVMTALIERDNEPGALEQKKRAVAASPLPPGIALNKPATNIYVTQIASQQPEVPSYDEPARQTAAPPAEATPTEEGPPSSATVDHFYDSLSPYGNWVQVPDYGLCWQPTVAVVNAGWRPYGDRGRWLWSSSGWYWYSDYSWGWAPFHYGRWYRYPASGWVWVPGAVWGPSWVTWRYTDGYCGWAPLPPYAHYSAGLGLTYHHDSVHVSFGFGFGYSDYSFVPWNRFCDYYPYHHYVHGHNASVIYKNSTAVNRFAQGPRNSIVNQGMGRELAARNARRNIDEVAIRPEARSVSQVSARPERLVREGQSMAIVRPQLPDTPPRSATPRPSAGGHTGAGAGQPSRLGTDVGTVGGASAIARPSPRNTAVDGSAISGISRPVGGNSRAIRSAPTTSAAPQSAPASGGNSGQAVVSVPNSTGNPPIANSQGRVGRISSGTTVVRQSRPSFTAPPRVPTPSSGSVGTRTQSAPTMVNPPSGVTRPPSIGTRTQSAPTMQSTPSARPSFSAPRTMIRSVPVNPGPSPITSAPASSVRSVPATSRAVAAPQPTISRPPSSASTGSVRSSAPSRGSSSSGRQQGRGGND